MEKAADESQAAAIRPLPEPFCRARTSFVEDLQILTDAAWETGWISPAVESPAIASPLFPYFAFQFPWVEVSNCNQEAVAGSGLIANVATVLTPDKEAVNVTDVDELTGFPRIAKVADDDPAGTAKVDGKETALAFEVDIATTNPPLGAAALSVTVAVADCPATIVLGLMANPDKAGGVTVTLTFFETLE